MHRIVAIALITVILSGCAAQVLDSRPTKTYFVGQSLYAPVGDAILKAQTGTLRTVRRWVGILNSPDGWMTSVDPSSDFVSKELIYSGKIGNTIELSYREFRGGLAAPAFYQTVKYDLGESPLLTFQNFQIQVLTATNTEFKGKLLKD